MSRLGLTAWALVTMWPSGETTKPEATLRFTRVVDAETGIAGPVGGATAPRSASSGSDTNGVENDTDVMLTTTARSATTREAKSGGDCAGRGSDEQHHACGDRQASDRARCPANDSVEPWNGAAVHVHGRLLSAPGLGK
jgi:hypothetical protein